MHVAEVPIVLQKSVRSIIGAMFARFDVAAIRHDLLT